MAAGRTVTLRATFLRFLMEFIAGLAVSVAVPWTLLWLAVNFGLANYSDASEKEAKTAASLLETASDEKAVLGQLSGRVEYLILDADGQVADTSMDEEDAARAVQLAQNGTVSYDTGKQYLRVERGDAYIILQYEMGSFYTNEWMEAHLPSPEYLLIGLIAFNVIVYSVFLITRFEKKLQRQLAPVFSATREITAQNLDFEVGHSKIREFEDILISFSDMKEELGNSLKEQWKAEQYQKEQIAALAHDLKTPLTIAQGNLDLLGETAVTQEQAQYAAQASDSVGRMTDYVQLLIGLSKASIGYEYRFCRIDATSFVDDIAAQASVLCGTKQIDFHTERSGSPEAFYGDSMLLGRAVMNLITNAVEHTPEQGRIVFSVSSDGGELTLAVTDSGGGFSAEALSHATELFFMTEHSRNSDLHFGMGLYFAESVAKKHHGTLTLENCREGGARVAIRLPAEKKKI